MLYESFQNFRELSNAREPFLTVGIGVALPLLNPRLAGLGLDIYRQFRQLDNQLEETQGPFNKTSLINWEVEAFEGFNSRSRFNEVLQAGDPYLVDCILHALHALQREQEFETAIGVSEDEDIYDLKIGNSYPYQIIAAYLLFNKRIDPHGKRAQNFMIMSGLLQNGDDLRDLGEDVFKHRLHFTKDEKKRLIKGNRFSIPGVILETFLNIGNATAQFARTTEIPDLPKWLADVWVWGNYAKVMVDAIATLSPLNLYRLSKIRLTDDILRNI